MAALTSIPTAPGALPLLGHLLPLIRGPLGFLESLPEHGDLVRVLLGPAPAVVVCDPTLTRQVMRDDRAFDKGGVVFDRAREVVGGSLLTSPHDRHRRQRRLVQPSFHPTRFPGYARMMTDHAAAVVSEWRDEQILDVFAEMTTITSTTLTAAMFSTTLPAPALHQAHQDVIDIIGGVDRRMLTPRPLDRLPTPGNRRYHRALARLRHSFGDVVAGCRASGVDRGDLLWALLTAPALDGDGDGLDDAEIVDLVLMFFLAGTETTAIVLAWTLHLLAGDPDVERRVHAEVDTVLGDRPGTYDDVPRLKLTGRVVAETLRLRPPTWALTRVVAADTHLGGHPLPAGTTVVFSPYLIHHRADLHPDPDRFDPDRWLPERARAIPRDAYIPFGGGARVCIGDQFGITETVLALATIAARWRLEPLPGTGVRIPLASLLRPRGLRMRAIRRAPERPVVRGEATEEKPA
ncbi:MAG: cytochrome P450 [Stackebrandtia sp.]